MLHADKEELGCRWMPGIPVGDDVDKKRQAVTGDILTVTNTKTKHTRDVMNNDKRFQKQVTQETTHILR